MSEGGREPLEKDRASIERERERERMKIIKLGGERKSSEARAALNAFIVTQSDDKIISVLTTIQS